MNLMKYLPRIVRKHPLISLAVAVVVAPPVIEFARQKYDELVG